MRCVRMGVAAVLMCAAGAMGAERGAGLAGVWLVDSAEAEGFSQLSRVWGSELKIGADGRFALSGYNGMKKTALTGRMVMDAGGVAGAIDLEADGVDMSEVWSGVVYPKCTLPGIYKVEAGVLTVCFMTGEKRERPGEFASGKETYLVRFVREKAGFAGFPKEVRVRVVDEEGKPVAGASVYVHAVFSEHKKGVGGSWGYYVLNQPVTGADGTTVRPYEKMDNLALQARDAEGTRVGYTVVSPGNAQEGTATVVLHPACHVVGKIACAELTKMGKEMPWTNVMVYAGGQNAIDCESLSGDFSFDVPRGEYLLDVYGEDLHDKEVRVSVTEKEVRVPTVMLEASQLLLLKGELAPELKNVAGWKGDAVTFAGLRGKLVLVDFWGYWCGPCVRSMPTLIDLQEKFGGKGLAIVGVHQDLEGEVDTAAKLEEKTSEIRKGFWGGRDLPFPVALTSGKHVAGVERASDEYGVLYFPTTVVIDREGKVVGKFEARDEKSAEAAVEKLLGK